MTSQQPTASAGADPASAKIARVKTLACLGGISLERGVAMDEVHGYVKDPTNIVWVDIQDAGPEEFSMLLEEFGFHPLALEDAAKGQRRPKVDEYKGYLFTVIYGVSRRPETGEFATREVALFIGRNYLISLQHGPLPAMDDAVNRWTRGGRMLSEGIGFLVYTVMDAIIDTFFPMIHAIEQELDESKAWMPGPTIS